MCQRREDISASGTDQETPRKVLMVGENPEPLNFAPLSEILAQAEGRELAQNEFPQPLDSLEEIEFARKNKKRKRRVLQAKKKGLFPIPPGVTFFYFGQPTAQGSSEAGARGHHGVMTVAMKLEKTPDRILLGFAFCNSGNPRKNIPPDIYCKVEGRDRATERLYDDPVVVPYLSDPRRLAQTAIAAVAAHEFKRLSQYGVQMPRGFEDLVPHWTKQVSQRPRRKQRRSPATSFLSEAAAISLLAMEAIRNHKFDGAPIKIICTSRQMGRSSIFEAMEKAAGLDRK